MVHDTLAVQIMGIYKMSAMFNFSYLLKLTPIECVE